MLNIALPAPMPSARVRTTTKREARLAREDPERERTSWMKPHSGLPEPGLCQRFSLDPSWSYSRLRREDVPALGSVIPESRRRRHAVC